MKNLKIYFILTAVTAVMLLVAGCKKAEDQYPSKTVPVTYPGIVLKGDSVVSITVGTPYTDAGATLIDDISGAQSDIEATENDVDVNTPGLYMVTYQASNANGFTTIKQRPVAVTDVSATWDLSGNYQRTANSVDVGVTKIANGLYIIDNVGGVDPSSPQFIFPVYMAQLDDVTITIPAQVIADGTVLDCLDEELSAMPGDTSFTYVVDNVSFGTAPRTFAKQ